MDADRSRHPVEAKDPANWPASMAEEWDDDQGVAAAAHHRKILVENLLRCRDALDEFRPDVVVVWGDDQYENFREEVVPPFCVLAYDDVEVEPFQLMNKPGQPNAWGLPDDTTITLHGDADGARRLAGGLMPRLRYRLLVPEAQRRTVSARDRQHPAVPRLRQRRAQFPYPMIPITVNCYGQHAIARRGGLARFAESRTSSSTRRAPAGTLLRVGPRGGAAIRATPTSASRWSRRRVGRTRSSPTRPGTLPPTPPPTRGSTSCSSTGDYETWQAPPATTSSTPANTRCSIGSA